MWEIEPNRKSKACHTFSLRLHPHTPSLPVPAAISPAAISPARQCSTQRPLNTLILFPLEAFLVSSSGVVYNELVASAKLLLLATALGS